MKTIKSIDFTEEQQKKINQYTLLFANLKKNIIQDLYNNHNESIIYKKYPKDRVIKMFDNPQRNEKAFRELSGFLYLASSHYRRLVDYYASILLYNYTVVPTNIPQKVKKAEYRNTYMHVIQLCEKYNLRQESKKAIKIAVRDGVFYGLYYETNDSFYIKPFNNRYAQVSSVEDGCFRFSIDLNYFSGKEYLLDMYGTKIKNAYYQYKGNKEKNIKPDKTKRWYEPSNGICIKADETDPVYSLPMFTGLMINIFDIEDYSLLKKAKAENENYKALAMKMAVDDNGIPKMDYDLAMKYYNQAAGNIPDGIGLILSPFEIQDFSFHNSSTAERDAVVDAEENFFFSAGTSPLIFGSSKATSSSSLSLSVKPDEEVAFGLLEQVQRFFNKKLKKLNLPYDFAIKFLDQSIFNRDEFTNRLQKAASYGVPVKMQYSASLGLSPSDTVGMSYIEDDILGLGKKVWSTPLVSSATQSNKSDNKGGRPTAEESGNQIGDSGEKTRDLDGNDR